MTTKTLLALTLLAALAQLNCGGEGKISTGEFEQTAADEQQRQEQQQRIEWCTFTVSSLCIRETECGISPSITRCITDLYAKLGMTCDDVAKIDDPELLNYCPDQLANAQCTENWHITAPACFHRLIWNVMGNELRI